MDFQKMTLKKLLVIFFVKFWFFEILCYRKHRIQFWGHSASENVGAAYGGSGGIIGLRP